MHRKVLDRFSTYGASPVSIAAVVLLFLVPLSAHSLSCAAKTFTLSEAYEAADSIVVGVITDCKEATSSDPWARGGGDCSFDSVEVLKESTPARDYRGSASSSGCGLSLHVGNQYLLFLDNENRPIRYSSALLGEHPYAKKARQYAEILRAYRDGQVADLSEPWTFHEDQGGCTLRHHVGGNTITFSQRKAGTPPPSDGWTQESINGKTVLRSPPDPASGTPEMEFIVSGDVHEYPDDVQVMTVSLRERLRPAMRQASISVGNRTWPLLRSETTLVIRGREAGTQVDYLAAAETSEDILAAVRNPSAIVVTATLVASQNIDPDPPAEAARPEQDAFVQSPPDGVYPSETQPEANAAGGAIPRHLATRRTSRNPQMTPEPVLRLKTRSTQLPAEIDRYRACIGDDAR